MSIKWIQLSVNLCYSLAKPLARRSFENLGNVVSIELSGAGCRT